MTGLQNFYKRMERTLKKSSIFANLLIILALLFILICIYKGFQPKREGFINQKEKFTVKKGIDMYDDFYVNIYDQLFFKEISNQYEVGSIQNITKPTSESIMLVIGSGTGHIVEDFKKQNIKAIGLEESKNMIKYAKTEYPNLKFVQGTPLTAMLFTSDHFTHIISLNMNFYAIKDKKTYLQNVYNWLKPGGYFVLKVVDKNKFDPVIPAAKPFIMVNPQSFAENRITTSNVIFNNFNYKADFQIFPNDFVQFLEIFKDTTPGSNKTRQNIHKMWIPTRQKVLNLCKETGFITYAEVDLLMGQMEYQYLYIFIKPE